MKRFTDILTEEVMEEGSGFAGLKKDIEGLSKNFTFKTASKVGDRLTVSLYFDRSLLGTIDIYIADDGIGEMGTENATGIFMGSALRKKNTDVLFNAVYRLAKKHLL